jgi:hypothetical protein
MEPIITFHIAQNVEKSLDFCLLGSLLQFKIPQKAIFGLSGTRGLRKPYVSYFNVKHFEWSFNTQSLVKELTFNFFFGPLICSFV